MHIGYLKQTKARILRYQPCCTIRNALIKNITSTYMHAFLTHCAELRNQYIFQYVDNYPLKLVGWVVTNLVCSTLIFDIRLKLRISIKGFLGNLISSSLFVYPQIHTSNKNKFLCCTNAMNKLYKTFKSEVVIPTLKQFQRGNIHQCPCAIRNYCEIIC